MGYEMTLDGNADAKGNFTLVALAENDLGVKGGDLDTRTKPMSWKCSISGLYPTGTFIRFFNKLSLPRLKLTKPIQWPHGRPPLAVPRCGFEVGSEPP